MRVLQELATMKLANESFVDLAAGVALRLNRV